MDRDWLGAIGTESRSDALAGGISETEDEPGQAAAAERFFDLSLDLLCVVGVDGYFKLVNPAWSRTLGYSEAELKARPYLELVHPDDRRATVAEADKLAGGFQTVHFRNRYRCKDGSYRWLAWTATPAMADGTIYAGARDVTNLVLGEEEELLLVRLQLEHVKSAIETRAFNLVFQPIVDFRTGEVIGLEALSRFHGAPYRPPDAYFAEADAVGLLPELEMKAIREAIPYANRLPPGVFLSVNASPETLLTKSFNSVIDAVDGGCLVIEVTEHEAVEDYDRLWQAIARLRAGGIRLAIDDAGAGFSSLKHIVRLVPEFIKLDLFLTRDIDRDPVKRALAAAMVSFATEIGAVLIAEGVETEAEVTALDELGFDDAQGFYFGKPRRAPGKLVGAPTRSPAQLTLRPLWD